VLLAADTHPLRVSEMVTIARLSVPRWVIASGQGLTRAQRLPLGYVARETRNGRGPSLYLAINRDHYERDWFSADGRRIHWRVHAWRHGRPGRLLHDVAFGPGYREWAIPSLGVVRRRHGASASDGGTPSAPLTPLEAFRRERALGTARRVGTVRGLRRYVTRDPGHTIVWLVSPRTGRLREEALTERGVRDGRRFVMVHRIRVVSYRRLGAGAAALRRLHVAG